MDEIGVWDVTSGKPQYFQRGFGGLERELEDWIAWDPSLIQRGMDIIGRQMRVETGILDLLGLDPLGNLAVIEIKRGNVQQQTVLQAVNYAACIDEMPGDELTSKINAYLYSRKTDLETLLDARGLDISAIEKEQRDITIFIVGTGRDHNLERITKILSIRDKPINVVSFDVFEGSSGQRILMRELTTFDSKDLTTRNSPGSNAEIERLIQLADTNGIGKIFRLIHKEAIRHGLYPRTYKWSIMYAPQQNKTRVLFCAWAVPKKGNMTLYIASPAFAEFFPISEREAISLLGDERNEYLSSEQAARSFVTNLQALFDIIRHNQDS